MGGRAATGGGIASARIGERALPAAPVLRPVLVTFLIAACLLVIRVFSGPNPDYVGSDNDDVMRLVQVRDLLAGQGWFDPMQYRLGLDGGTEMHWSRLVDLPIANLTALFQVFLPGMAGEVLALAAWPLMLLLALLAALALSVRHLGADTVFAALLLGAMFAVGINRFGPGSIDHHNLQLVLIAAMAGGLVQPGAPKAAFGVAGVAAALAIAVGAETAPLVAGACLVVAGTWLFLGDAVRPGVEGFVLGFAAALTAAFFPFVPPAAKAQAVCDAYSAGFYVLGVIGAGSLFAVTAVASGRSLAVRTGALGLVGATSGLAVLLIAPHCLESPLAGLDPMLVELWLSKVTEAQSVADVAMKSPEALAGHYLVPLGALGLCLLQAWRGESVGRSLKLAALIAIALLVAMVQVRGAVFSNLLAIFVLAPLVARFRRNLRARPDSPRAAAIFCLAVIAATPVAWAVGGHLIAGGNQAGEAGADPEGACDTGTALAPLAKVSPGVVSAVSNLGAPILRHTDHRVLSAPYHRNQGGMLTQLHIAMEPPESARAFLRGAGVGIVVFCPSDPETAMMARRAPGGLYAAMLEGKVPAYLEPLPGSSAGLGLYRVR